MQRVWRVFVIIGTMLLLAALFLVLYNIKQDKASGEAARAVLEQLWAEIEAIEATTETEETESGLLDITADLFSEYLTAEPIEEETEVSVELTIPIDGREYIGVIQIPSLGVELPVLAEWSYPNLRIAPCRYDGTASEGNLIVAAHNYSSHFGKISGLSSGSRIYFTDVTGKTYRYEVIQTETIAPTAISSMTSGSEEWDLTLFTCTLSGQARVTVRAVLLED